MFNKNDILNNYKLIKFLGKGATAEVWSASNGGNLYALKIFGFGVTLDAYAKAEIRKEFSKTKDLYHPNIIRAIDFFEENGASVLVQELGIESLWQNYLRRCPADQGNLISDRNENSVHHQLNLYTEKELAKIVLDISSALFYLHQNGIVHDDIKPGNFVIRQDENGDVYYSLIDFGISRNVRDTIQRLTKSDVNSNAAFSTLYAAPEKHSMHESSIEGDIFSLGVSILDLTNRESNPPGVTINAGGEVQELKGNYSLLFKNLIKGMLRAKSTERFKIEDVKRHSQFYNQNGYWSNELKNVEHKNNEVKTDQIRRKTNPLKVIIVFVFIGLMTFTAISILPRLITEEKSCASLNFKSGYACFKTEASGIKQWGLKDENCNIIVPATYCMCIKKDQQFLLKCNETDKFYFDIN